MKFSKKQWFWLEVIFGIVGVATLYSGGFYITEVRVWISLSWLGLCMFSYFMMMITPKEEKRSVKA